MTAIVERPLPLHRRIPLFRLVAAIAGGISLIPMLVLLACFFLLPLLYMVRMSLLPDRALAMVAALLEPLSLHQYATLLVDGFFYEMVANSLRVGGTTVVIALAAAYPVAWYLIRVAGSWERTLVSAACMLPLFVNLVVTVFGWNVLLLPFGALQKLLSALGWVDGPIYWARTFWGLSIVLAYETVPFAILILAASIQTIRVDKLNAARILGAGNMRIFLTIVVPLTMPGIVASAILVFSLAISSYLIPTLIAGTKVVVLPLEIFSYITEFLDWPAASAMAILLLVLVFALTWVFTMVAGRLSRRGKWVMV